MSDKVCVIGAGSSGLTTIKALKEAGIPFDCFEMGSNIGGNWRYNNDNGRSAAYNSLHIDTSKERMEFSDFPMPDDYPNYPHHTQVLDYFERYATHFGLRPYITFRTKVEHVAPAAAGGYDVTVRAMDGGETETRRYRAVIVCNGHHWNPRLPDFPGAFDGFCMHSRDYREPSRFAGQNVLVVGIGNSGVDIACDISHVADHVYLSTRQGAHIIPRYILGRPTDKWVTERNSRLPFRLQRFVYNILLFLAVGNQENYGVPRPNHPILSAHPTMSAELLDAAAHGRVTIRPNVAELRGDHVRFADGRSDPVDSIVYATGYRITFPFFDPGFFSVNDNEIALYRNVVHPEHENLYFIGFIQPLGAIMPLAELQAQWVAGLLGGRMALPGKYTMRQEIARRREALRRRYVASPRHTIQVDFYPYKRLLQEEMNDGRRRAARPPV